MPVLSVHLITFNNEMHIEETLQSILNQKVDFEYEIVVGDDCSSDRTLEIITDYSEKHPGLFKILKNESQLGILKNFKATLDRCTGKYVFDIAGDDLFNTEHALQKMVAILQSDDSLGFVDSGFDEYIEYANTTNRYSNKTLIESDKDAYKKAILSGAFTPIGICFNREKIYQYVDFDTYIKMNVGIEDYPMLVDLIMNTSVETIKESLHIYRVHKTSYSHTKKLEDLMFQKQQMMELFNYFTNKYNFNTSLVHRYYQNHYKHSLYLAGYFEDGKLGKKMFSKINSKNIRDYIHYWASQNKLFRKLVSLF
ncbi:glycosyltransferase family 2 protein [Algibacter sp. 2305UL17-15]|uniref:glycosyltransferase family 2 protein n=1 Tax=Algibacter sp. 2305UL17-15 TaxID=3231268 RepID=UPI00345A1029